MSRVTPSSATPSSSAALADGQAGLPTAPPGQALPTIDHAGMLEDLFETPPYVLPNHERGRPQIGLISCSYCGVGDSGVFGSETPPGIDALIPSVDEKGKRRRRSGSITVLFEGRKVKLPARVNSSGQVEVGTTIPLTPPGGGIRGELIIDGMPTSFLGRAVGSREDDEGRLIAQIFAPHTSRVKVTKFKISEQKPTTGCVKLRISTMRQRAAYPIHTAPTILDPETGTRKTITYQEAISRLADMVMAHRAEKHRTLLYGSGQLDYFSIFAMQEVFRLLGVRNMTGNAEHCLNAGAVHNEILTGQEGPFITLDQAMDGHNRVFLMNGWNGMITHPPVYRALTRRELLDGYLVEVMVTETAKGLAQKMGIDRIMLIRPRADAHIALAVAHEIINLYPHAIDQRFVERFSDNESFQRFRALAASAQFAPDRVAERVAPEPKYEKILLKGIRMLAVKMADPDTVPIIIPSVGLSQSSGVVAHCIWGSVLAMLGKYGLKAPGEPAGGVLRVPGQINAETEVQGLSRKYFMGRIPLQHSAEAARRMGLPENAYQRAEADVPRTALDYSEPTPGEKELFLCFGTQFEANMPNRRRWIDKLKDPQNSLVVVDPIPDPWSIENAHLIIPSPPHPATTKLYQNGEWRLSISIPQKQAAPETRSDATIIYDLMAEITRRLESQPELGAGNQDLMPHVHSGYLRNRFCPPQEGSNGSGGGLTRLDGEVSRVELWDRVQAYLHGGSGPLYCSLDHADGRPIEWQELIDAGSLVYGGVGDTRYHLDYDNPDSKPFRDIYRNPAAFRFFLPTEADLAIPEGIIFNSGRSSLTDDRQRLHFATSTFNSVKATPIVKIPDEHPLYVPPALADRLGLVNGQMAKVTSATNGYSIELPVVISDRVKGESVYVSFHRSKAQDARGLYVNDVTDHVARCPYSAQVQLKTPHVTLSRVEAQVAEPLSDHRPAPGMKLPPIPTGPAFQTEKRVDMTVLDTVKKIPLWNGTDTPLYVTDIFQETHDSYTFRFQGDPLCRFAYKPGQFCSLVLNIDGKKVVRSYSISSTPTRPYLLELTVKRVEGGLVSNWLPDNLKVGDRIQIKGPKGKFHLEPGSIPKKILFVGAGSGVTPLMAMSRWLCDISADVDIKFYYSVRSSKDMIFGKEIEMMTERYRQFTPCVISTTRGANEPWTGLTGRVNKQMLEIIAPDLHDRHLFMCGPEGFMEAVKDILRDLKFDLGKLHSESFGGTRTAQVETPTVVVGDAPKAAMSVQFARAGKTLPTNGQLPILDLAEEADIDIDYGCRSGSCGDCKVKLLSGKVDCETDEGLTEEEIAEGYFLSCVASPKGDCTIDA